MLHSINLRTVSGGVTGKYLSDIKGEASLAVQLADPGQLEFDYPNSSPTAPLIMNNLVIDVEVDGLRANGLRFVYDNRTGNQADIDGTQHYTFRQIQDGLRSGDWRAPAQEQTRSWTNATPGQIMIDAYTAAKARGCFAWMGPIGLGFTASADSHGTPWPNDMTVELQYADKSVWEVWEWLLQNGYVELWSVGGVLNAYVPGGLKQNYVGPNPTLKLGLDIDDAPFETDSTDVVTDLTVIGDHDTIEGNVKYLYLSGPVGPLGRREKSLRVQGVKDETTLTDIGTQWLATHGSEREQRTWRVSPTANVFPFTNFSVGDNVGIATRQDPMSSGTYNDRVVGISVTWQSSTQMTPIITTNTLLDDRDRRLEHRLSKYRGN